MLLLAGCTLAEPFHGPLFDPDLGLLDDRDQYVVAVTHARRAAGGEGELKDRTEEILVALDRQPGIVGWSLREEWLGRDTWTLTVWTDEPSLDAFVTSEPHAGAMAAAGDLTDAGSTARFVVARDEVPVDWSVALSHLPD